jgi:hypothetical protein
MQRLVPQKSKKSRLVIGELGDGFRIDSDGLINASLIVLFFPFFSKESVT